MGISFQYPDNWQLDEEEIRAGLLDRYDALCLHDVRVLPDDVHAKIQAFADRGKLVLVDESNGQRQEIAL